MTATTGGLTAEEVDRYWHDGFLFPVRVFDADEARVWRDRIEATEAMANAGDLPEPFVNYARANFNLVSTAAAELAHHPAILDLVEPILGPDLLCWMTELIIKEPRTEKMLTMHQDMTYWGLDDSDNLVTVWLALSDVLESTGAMRFVRGSHRAGQVSHEDTFGEDNLLSRGQRVSATYWADDEVCVELAPGEVSLHHGLMAHGSGPNVTDARRVALVLRYVTPAIRQVVGRQDFAMTVRGSNTTGNLIPIERPVADFDAAALARFETVTQAQAEALAEDADQELSYDRTN